MSDPADGRTLLRTLERIESGDRKTRSSAITELKSVFGGFTRANIKSLGDKSYHQIYEILFKIIIPEKQAFLKAKTASAETLASTRLKDYGDALRLAVKAGSTRLKGKTVEAVADHVIQVLPNAAGGYCEPLAVHYFKILSSLLENPTNVERLKQETWYSLVNFCVNGIEEFLSDSDEEHSGLTRTFSGLGTGQSSGSTGRALGRSQSYNHSRTSYHIADLFQIILRLVSTPNAPLAETYTAVAGIALRFLETEGQSVGQIHQIAFSILNAILQYTRANQIAFTTTLACKTIPIISRIWQGKNITKDEMLNNVRDEIFVFMFSTFLYLERVVTDEKTDEISSNLEELLETLRADYSARSERDQLHLDDLELTVQEKSFHSNPFHIGLFQLRPHNTKAERKWALLSIIGILERLVSLAAVRKSANAESSTSDENMPPIKRQRTTQAIDRLLSPLRSMDEKVQSAALQMIPFILENCQISVSQLSELLGHLIQCAGNKRGNIASWALIAMASCNSQSVASDLEPDELMQIWQLGARLLPFTTTCRAASLQLHSLLAQGLVRFHDVAEDANSIMTAMESNGPAVLCESSIFLMIRILHARVAETPGASLSASHHIVRWAFARWDPVDRTFATQFAVHVQPSHLADLIRSCLGLPLYSTPQVSLFPCGPVAQAWQKHLDSENVIRYLLLLQRAPAFPSIAGPPSISSSDSTNVAFTSNTAHFVSTRKLLLELLQSKCADVLQSWTDYHTTSLVSSEIYRSIIYACIGMSIMMAHLTGISSAQLEPLGSVISELTESIANILTHSSNRDTKSALSSEEETLLQSVHPYIPSYKSNGLVVLIESTPHLLRMLLNFAARISSSQSLADATSRDADDDLMDADDQFMDDRIQGTPTQAESDERLASVPRQQASLAMWSGSFYRVVAGQLQLLSAFDLAPERRGYVPSTFVDYLTSLEPNEIMASRDLLTDVLLSDLALGEEDAERLLEALTNVVGTDRYERCEVSWILCAEVLVELGSHWSKQGESDVADMACQLYTHLITKILGRGIGSPLVQKAIADLLIYLVESNSDYGIDVDLKTPRTYLFTILQESNIDIKFHISDRLPEIFRHYLLSTHEELFTDVLNQFSRDPEHVDTECIEEISLRLYTCAKLASTWPTLLRRSIYSIFETAGGASTSIRHSTKCLADVSVALNLGGSRDLFSLFAPQLLYTWLSIYDIADIPYAVFGFYSLSELLERVQHEITAIMVMRDQKEAIKALASLLHTDQETLIRKCFARAMAYKIAWDISQSNTGEPPGEPWIKRVLGQEVFTECLIAHFTDIIAALFIAMSLEKEKISKKYFPKGNSWQQAAAIMAKIEKIGSPKSPLPVGQQPTFRGKFLCHEIEYFCSRTPFAAVDIYSPAMVTYVARSLFNTIHAALGSLHACSVLQKIRVLIALAGPSATRGYPLEMFIRSIERFLIDPECAEDAIAMLQYLIREGTMYLSQMPQFVAGVAVSIFGSLSTLLATDNANTQHLVAKTKAQAFHSWFGQYLESYNSPQLDDLQRPTFQTLVSSAFHTGSRGSSEINTAESRLLVQLLADERLDVGFQLLDRPSRSSALARLSSQFHKPSSFRSDELGRDNTSVDYATVILKSCSHGSANEQYLSWAARVIGRAFATSGTIPEELLHESSISEIKTIGPHSGDTLDSKAYILCLLDDLTLGLDSHIAGLAESALRFVFTQADQDLLSACGKYISAPLYNASLWENFQISPSAITSLDDQLTSLDDVLEAETILEDDWVQKLLVGLAQSLKNQCLLNAIVPILQEVPRFAHQAFPFVVHLVLISPSSGAMSMKRKISDAFKQWFQDHAKVNKKYIRILINAVLYLRTQALPHEKSSADRAHWLNIDYLRAATAASHCGMFKTALLFLEEFCSQPAKSSRRSSTMKDSFSQADLSNEILLAIFENIDDPDMYYGVQQASTLKTILSRFEHERDGPKSLAFRGAQYDSHIRRQDSGSNKDVQALVNALDVLNLSGLSHTMLQAQQTIEMDETALTSMFKTARKLERWDLPVPSTYENSASIIYKAFQSIHTANDRGSILHALDCGLQQSITRLAGQDLGSKALHETLQALAALVEMDEVFTSRGSEEFEDVLHRFKAREQWMKTGSFDDIGYILSCRGTTLSTLSQDNRLQSIVGVEPIDTRLIELSSALVASKIYRAHDSMQEALTLATSMTDLIGPCSQVGIRAEVAVHLEAANALWDQGEMGSSIGMLQVLDDVKLLKTQTISVGRSHLLSTIGHRVSVARLEKAETVLVKYLKPALAELKGVVTGSEAGQVYHQFAVFCDEQLQDPDGLEDLERLRKLSANKEKDVQNWDRLISQTKTPSEKSAYRKEQHKSKKFLEMDHGELQRQLRSREELLRQCLENYLLALGASDDYNRSALRFSSLWFEHFAEQLANEAVAKHIEQVPSHKFASLMNQFSSRLQNTTDIFQRILINLVLRICVDHPYHSLYHIYAGVSTPAGKDDKSAKSRQEAATSIVRALEGVDGAKVIWSAIFNSNRYYCHLAAEKDDKYKSGKRFYVKDSHYANRLSSSFSKYKVPPPTMSIELSPSRDYSNVPTMVHLDPQFSIASGVSMPKIITAIADDGIRYKQLVKGGNDDLRQDAIMEQVFEQVSELLKTNKSTRQRNLHIRTYRVLPLTQKAGVIEFVANTIPLHDYLIPAHEKYHPKDWKASQCRREISEADNKPVDTRIKAFRTVTEHFQPVMKHFFTEKFHSPDEWFVKRLAYTRTTAAISILGHVVGLGDRHGHNILLDSQHGEVVHIDLGIAFESGRVLPVPETIPFRLTRDIIDGMGITKTEGVFRRCCEFTLEALRKEAYSIMTILDVLRYDPLYSWSVSPVRLAKLQEGHQGAMAAAPDGNNDTPQATVNEPGEADRALTVVNKKLSKTLSSTATVNDLINQAVDEKNLACLFSGWAAYV